MDNRTIQKPLVGEALWPSRLAPHALENLGEREFRAISVEVKRAR